MNLLIEGPLSYIIMYILFSSFFPFSVSLLIFPFFSSDTQRLSYFPLAGHTLRVFNALLHTFSFFRFSLLLLVFFYFAAE